MATKNTTSKEELSIIRAELSALNDKLTGLLDPGRSPSTGCRSFGLRDHLLETIDFDLERRMVTPCDCRPSCKSVFTDVLQQSAGLVGEHVVDERRIMDLRHKLDQAKLKAPYKKCSLCFEEVYQTFDGHVRMVRSQNSYVSEQNLRALIKRMDEEKMVQALVDPIANPQRLEIMKMMVDEPRNYSALSAGTGLKGGNLLFHLRRLTVAGMISQNDERGDYRLTQKGNSVLRYLMLMALELKEENWV